MITVEVLITEVSGLRRQDLENWISRDWVRPDQQKGEYLFQEIDVARVRLIRELRDEMAVNEETLPIVLSLLDQVYELRRRVREIGDVIEHVAPQDVREEVVRRLRR